MAGAEMDQAREPQGCLSGQESEARGAQGLDLPSPLPGQEQTPLFRQD